MAFVLAQHLAPSHASALAEMGWGQEEHRQKSREAGFDYHLIKPVDYEVLRKVLAEQQP